MDKPVIHRHMCPKTRHVNFVIIEASERASWGMIKNDSSVVLVFVQLSGATNTTYCQL
jgi:hypothetical protein